MPIPHTDGHFGLCHVCNQRRDMPPNEEFFCYSCLIESGALLERDFSPEGVSEDHHKYEFFATEWEAKFAWGMLSLIRYREVRRFPGDRPRSQLKPQIKGVPL